MNPLSLSYYTVPEVDALETVAVAAACGCQHVGLRLLNGQPDGPAAPLLANPALRREMRQRLADNGVTALDANSARLLPQTSMAAFGPFLAAAAELGARHVTASGDDPDSAQLCDRFGLLADMAAKEGLRVEIEFVPWLAVGSLGDAATIVRAVGRDNLGILVDALHFDRSGSSLVDLAAMPRDWFAFAQLCDAPRVRNPDRKTLLNAAVSERLFPGEGEIDLAGLIHALPSALPLALEIPTATLARSVPARDRVARAVAATRALLARIDCQETA